MTEETKKDNVINHDASGNLITTYESNEEKVTSLAQVESIRQGFLFSWRHSGLINEANIKVLQTKLNAFIEAEESNYRLRLTTHKHQNEANLSNAIQKIDVEAQDEKTAIDLIRVENYMKSIERAMSETEEKIKEIESNDFYSKEIKQTMKDRFLKMRDNTIKIIDKEYGVE